MSKRFVIIGALILVLCGGLVWFNFNRTSANAAFFARAGRPPVVVEASLVQQVTWKPVIEAVGTSHAQTGADLSAQASGVVQSVNFKPGDRATAGQILVQIDDSAERADMAAAQANIKLYRDQLSRASVLNKKGYATQASLDTARAQLEVAQSTYQRAKAISDFKAIKAPFAGVLGIAQVDVGQLVPIEAVIVTLQDLDQLKIDFTVPEQSAAQVHSGQIVRFGIDPTAFPFEGKVAGIDPKVDPKTHLVSVEAQLANPEHKILPGQFLRARIELPEEPGVLAVPQTALITSLYGDYVYLVKSEVSGDKAQKTVVQTFVQAGRRDLSSVEIKSGLKPGDLVVTSGQNKLQNGAPITLPPPPQASNAGGAG